MLLHIKPTADRADVFRFKSNFIRFFRKVVEGTDKEQIFDALTADVGMDDGIMTSCRNLTEVIDRILEKHKKACRDEVITCLRQAAKELQIEL